MLAQLLTLNTQKCAQQGITIVWQAASRLPRLVVAPDRIRQVFLNVILNAMDAMPQGGSWPSVPHQPENQPAHG